MNLGTNLFSVYETEITIQNEFSGLKDIFSERVELFFLNNITTRIKDYLKKADEVFG